MSNLIQHDYIRKQKEPINNIEHSSVQRQEESIRNGQNLMLYLEFVQWTKTETGLVGGD